MSFAHFKAKRSVANGSRRPYRELFRLALMDAHRANKVEGHLESIVKQWKAIDKRIENEKSVIRSIVGSAIAMGYSVSLYDGEEWTLKQSVDKAALMDAVMTTDHDKLAFRKLGELGVCGSVLLVYGNSASEVIADWSDNKEVNNILKNAIAQCERFSAKGL
jgi:UDP-N-acetylglucosamine 2-epimerase